MTTVTRACWCGAKGLKPFGPDYLRCPSCETLVSQAGLTDAETYVRDDLHDYYGKQYWLEHQTDDLGLPDIYARARLDLAERCPDWLRALLRYRCPPARVLEVGAGHGAYTALLGWAGFDATAVDLSQWTAEFARERFGIRYFVGPVEEHTLEPSSFDIIVANDVLEHLATPQRTVAAWLRLLKPDGLFFFQTPNYVLERTYEELVADDDPFLQHMSRASREHLYLFSRQAIEQLLGTVGLHELSFDDAIYSYDMFGVASALPIVPGDADPGVMLGAAPSGALALALLDARNAWQISEHDRAERLDVIHRLDAALRDATSAPAESPSAP